MFCRNCGKEIKDGTKFCSGCGREIVRQENVSDGTAAFGAGLLQRVDNNAQPFSQQPAQKNNAFGQPGVPASNAVNSENIQLNALQSEKKLNAIAQNPFAAHQTATPVASNPFENTKDNSTQSKNSFGTGLGKASCENIVTNNEIWNPDKEPKIRNKKSAKKETGSQTAKIVIMILLQFVFVGAIAVLAFTGKMNDIYGNINLTLTIVAFAAVLAVDALLYFIMFSKSSKKKLDTPAVIHPREKQEAPKYMDVSRGPSSAFAMGNIQKTERDKLLDNEEKAFASLSESKAEHFAENKPTNTAFSGASNVFSSIEKQNKEQAVFVVNTEKLKPEPKPAKEIPVVKPLDMTQTHSDLVGEDDYEATCIIESTFDDFGEETVLLNFPMLIFNDNGAEKRYCINKEEFIIGRMASKVDCTISNKNVGRTHAVIRLRGGVYYIQDLNSKNKTSINKGTPLNPENEYELHDNDVITLADSELVFKLP